MSSVQSLRDFITERLAAAAGEIFSEFERTMVQYEEVIDRQRRLLDVAWKPEIKLRRLDFPQHHVCKEEEVLSDHQDQNSCPDQDQNSGLDQDQNSGLDQDQNSGLDQEQNSGLDQDQNSGLDQDQNSGLDQEQNSGLDQDQNSGLDLDQNSGPYQDQNSGLDQNQNSGLDQDQNSGLDQDQNSGLVQDQNSGLDQDQNSSPDQQEPEPLQVKEEQEELCVSRGEEQPALKRETDTFMLTSRYQERDFPDPEPDAGQLYFHSSPLADDQNQEHVQILDSGPAADVAMAPRKRPRGRSHVGPSSLSHGRFHAQSGKKTVKCDVCGKFFRDKHDMQRHYRIHTGERPYECKVCRKSFTQNGTLLVHMKTHTGEKPFLCSTCGKNFPMRWILVAHMRIHTGERPYSCGECGKNFTHKNSLKHHMNISHDGNS